MTKRLIGLFALLLSISTSTFAVDPHPAPHKLIGAAQCLQGCVKVLTGCMQKSKTSVKRNACNTKYSRCLGRCGKGVPAITPRMTSVPGGFPCPKPAQGNKLVGCWVGQCRKSAYGNTYQRYALLLSAAGHYKHMKASYVSSSCSGTMSSLWSNTPGPLRKIDHDKAPTYTLYRKVPTSHGMGQVISLNHGKRATGGGYRRTVIVIRGGQLCFHEGHYSHSNGLKPNMAYWYDSQKPPKIDIGNCLVPLEKR